MSDGISLISLVIAFLAFIIALGGIVYPETSGALFYVDFARVSVSSWVFPASYTLIPNLAINITPTVDSYIECWVVCTIWCQGADERGGKILIYANGNELWASTGDYRGMGNQVAGTSDEVLSVQAFGLVTATKDTAYTIEVKGKWFNAVGSQISGKNCMLYVKLSPR